MTCSRDHTYREIDAVQSWGANGDISDEEANRREGELFDALERLEHEDREAP